LETAIVLIAFVIVAASLVFVVLNMGFATTQKSKTTIGLALFEAGSSLTISGIVVGDSVFLGNNITSIMIPIKLVSGGDSVDLNTTKAILRAKGDSIPNAVAIANIITENMLKGNSKIDKISVDTEGAVGIGKMLSTIEIVLLKN